MLGAREFPVPHVFGIGVRRPRDLIGQVGVPLHELGGLALGEAEKVVEDQDLTIAAGARAMGSGAAVTQKAAE